MTSVVTSRNRLNCDGKQDSSLKDITLIIVGKRAETISSVLSENQIAGEKARPERKALTEITHVNQWKE